MIDKVTIDRIYERADIVDVIGEFITLKKRGVNYLGHCPFHNERTPSFTVSAAKSIFKCFGCGKSGNAVGFIMEHENLTYVEALRYLAKKYHIEIEEKAPDPEQLAQQNKREAQQVLTNYAGEWFKEQLHKSEEGRSIGLSYFRERGFTDQIVERFQLGYSPSNRSAFSQAALKKGFKSDVLVDSGLSVDRNGTLFDRFADRVMFPIHSITGQVIGFGGRTMQKETNIAKYLNSPETALYVKSKVLYGIFQARKAITQNDSCFLVEGYTDVLSMHQSGIENVVASSGTSLTTEQIRLIRRFTPNLTVLYDGDAAGIKASLRGIDMILAEDMNVKVCLLPDGEDPDSFARKNPSDKFTAFIKENETDFIQFKTKLMLDTTKGDPIKKAAIVTDIIQSISCIPSMVTRSVYIQECSRMLDMPEDVLYQATNKIVRERGEKEFQREQRENRQLEDIPQETPANATQKVATPIKNDLLVTETEFIRFMLEFGDRVVFSITSDDSTSEPLFQTVAGYMIEELERDELTPTEPTLSAIFTLFSDALKKNVPLSGFYFTHNPDITISSKVADILAPGHTLSRIWDREDRNPIAEEIRLSQAAQKLVNEYKWRRLRDMQKILTQRLSAPDLSDVEAGIIMNKLNRINLIKTQLSSELGARPIF
jgi:DNA primase